MRHCVPLGSLCTEVFSTLRVEPLALDLESMRHYAPLVTLFTEFLQYIEVEPLALDLEYMRHYVFSHNFNHPSTYAGG